MGSYQCSYFQPTKYVAMIKTEYTSRAAVPIHLTIMHMIKRSNDKYLFSNGKLFDVNVSPKKTIKRNQTSNVN
jgi:hypothetical protein